MSAKLEAAQRELTSKYGSLLLCELPDHEFDFGGLVWSLTTLSGHHSGRATIGGLGLWNCPARNLLSRLN